MKAIFEGKVIAESDETLRIENDYYFPVESVKMDYLKKGTEVQACEIEGDACYYDLQIDGKILENVASTFSQPEEASENLKNYFVFKSPVRVTE